MRCEVRTANGQQCGALAVHGTRKCFLHSGTAREIGRRGGSCRRRLDGLKMMRPPRTPQQVRNLISQCIVELRSGALDAKRASTLVSASQVLLRAIDAADFDRRLSAIEAILQQRGGKPRKT